jgi:hypothetical protein
MIIEMCTYKTKPGLRAEGTLMPMLDKYEVVVVDDPDNLIRW